MSTDLHGLSGAYALDALSPEEAEAFRRHLDECAVCRTDVLEFRQAAARLGAAEAFAPPPELKQRVLAAAERTPQQPPKVTQLSSARRRGRTWLAAAAAAVVVAAGAAVGVSQLGDESEPTLTAEAAQIFAAEDHREASVRTDHGLVRVATSPSEGAMAVDATALEPLDEGVYKVWSIQDGRAVPGPAITGEVGGASMPMPSPGTTVAITVEPSPDVQEPTTEPFVEVDPREV